MPVGMTNAQNVIGRFRESLLALRLADNAKSAEVQRCSESAAYSDWESVSIGRPILPPDDGQGPSQSKPYAASFT